MSDTIKVNGSTFSKVSCHTRKSTAAAAAAEIRAGGKRATVRKTDGHYCAFSGPKPKTRAKGRPAKRRKATKK